jgi:hypothetical protein
VRHDGDALAGCDEGQHCGEVIYLVSDVWGEAGGLAGPDGHRVA